MCFFAWFDGKKTECYDRLVHAGLQDPRGRRNTETMKKQWYRLDNAALIFPAIIRKNWNNVFRVSATLKEPVDPEVLDRAIEELKPRFPT